MQITVETDAVWGSLQIAKYLGIPHHYSVLRLMKLGRIPGAKCIGGRWVISRAALDAYRRSQRQTAAA